jgi:methylthioribose-1-phosphate isomerase
VNVDGTPVILKAAAAVEETVVGEGRAQAIVQITPDLDLVGGGVYNPSFDVTPAELISALVTEKGVAERPAMESTINVSAVA